jgi:hypothetical protein
MTLAKARAKASAKTKHIYNTGVNYNHHFQLSKYFYSTGHSGLYYKILTIVIHNHNDTTIERSVLYNYYSFNLALVRSVNYDYTVCCKLKRNLWS